ncbi:MAG: hypothetical protein C0598_03770, partial [Marinilabiliales bacterium]
MKKYIIGIILLLSFTITYSQNIGDSLHAIHYIIDIENIDTDNGTIQANSSVIITPLEDNINGIALELINLTTDSVFV